MNLNVCGRDLGGSPLPAILKTCLERAIFAGEDTLAVGSRPHFLQAKRLREGDGLPDVADNA